MIERLATPAGLNGRASVIAHADILQPSDQLQIPLIRTCCRNTLEFDHRSCDSSGMLQASRVFSISHNGLRELFDAPAQFWIMENLNGQPMFPGISARLGLSLR
jgi:hypothetical protein